MNEKDAVPLGYVLLERLRKRLFASRESSRRAVAFLVRAGLLSEPLRHPKTGRDYSYRGNLRYCKHHAALRPSEALSLRVPPVTVYETADGSLSVDLPSADEGGRAPRISSMTVLRDAVTAARLAAFSDGDLAQLVAGTASRALARAIRVSTGTVAVGGSLDRFSAARSRPSRSPPSYPTTSLSPISSPVSSS